MWIKDHLGNEYHSKKEMIEQWGISHSKFDRLQKLGCTLKECLEGTAEADVAPVLRRLERYRDIDSLIESVEIEGKTYRSVRDIPVLRNSVSSGAYTYLLAKAFGFAVNLDDLVRPIDGGKHRRFFPKEIKNRLPVCLAELIGTLNLTSVTDRYYYRNSDVYASAFAPKNANASFSSVFRYQLGDYLFKDRKSLLTFLKMLGVPVNFDIDVVYQKDTDVSVVAFIKDRRIAPLSQLTDEELVVAAVNIFGKTIEGTAVFNKAIQGFEDENFATCDAVEIDDIDEFYDEMYDEDASVDTEDIDESDVITPTDATEVDDTAYVDIEDFAEPEKPVISASEVIRTEENKYFFIDYKGTVYTRMEDFESVYSCNWRSIYEHICNGHTLEEALAGGYFASTSDDGRYDFRDGVVIDGVHFESLKIFCTMVNVPCNVVLTRLRKGICTSVLDAVRKPTADRDVQSALFKIFVEKRLLSKEG